MINNGNGNPYHDKSGKFTSKGNQGAGGATPKSDPIVDFNKELWKSYFGGQPEAPKKTTSEKILNQMGLTNEEVMEKHEQKSEEKALNDLGAKMDKLEATENKPVQREYDFKVDEDGSAQLTFSRQTPVYGEGEGGEDYETTMDFDTIFEDLLADYVSDEDWHRFQDEPHTEEFVNEMMDKYYNKANDEYEKKYHEDWLTAQERDRAEDEANKKYTYEKYGFSENPSKQELNEKNNRLEEGKEPKSNFYSKRELKDITGDDTVVFDDNLQIGVEFIMDDLLRDVMSNEDWSRMAYHYNPDLFNKMLDKYLDKGLEKYFKEHGESYLEHKRKQYADLENERND